MQMSAGDSKAKHIYTFEIAKNEYFLKIENQSLCTDICKLKCIFLLYFKTNTILVLKTT